MNARPAPMPKKQLSLHNNTAWEGDRMLHIYLWDYFRKRGYNHAAQALVSEAGLLPNQEVPIDAPQGLIFEWWTVFWEIFTARSSDASQRSSFYTDSQAYVHSLDLNHSRALYEQQLQQHRLVALGAAQSPASWSAGTVAHPTRPPASTSLPSEFVGPQYVSRPPTDHQRPRSPNKHQDQPSTSVPLYQARGPLQTHPHLPNPYPTTGSMHSHENMVPISQFSPSNEREASSPQSALSQELSQMLNLPFPVSLTVVDQCLEMMKLGGRKVESLSHEQKNTLSNRVRRLHTAQNDAQMRMAQLHGLQPPKGTVTSDQRQKQSENQPPTILANQHGQKRKGSPTVLAQPERGPSVLTRSMSEQHIGSEARWPPNHGPFANGPPLQNGMRGASSSPSHHNFAPPPAPGPMQQHQQQQPMHAHSQNIQFRRIPHSPAQMQARPGPQGAANGIHANGFPSGQPSFSIDTNVVRPMGPPPSPSSGPNGPMYSAGGWAQPSAGAPPGQQQYQHPEQHPQQHHTHGVGTGYGNPAQHQSVASPAKHGPSLSELHQPVEHRPPGHYAPESDFKSFPQALSQPPGTDASLSRSNSTSGVLGLSGMASGSGGTGAEGGFGGLDFDFNAFLSGASNLDNGDNRALVEQFGSIAGL